MKIHVYGGALTLSYSMAKALRRRGLDVTLFTDSVVMDKSYSPAWEDEEITGRYPEWIQVVNVSFMRGLLGDRHSRRFAGLLADCDVVHLHGEAYLWANFFSTPSIFHSYGYDLDQLPFNRATMKQAILAYFCRRGIRKAAKVILAPHQRAYLERLGIAERGVYLPFPVDLDKYTAVDARTLRARILSNDLTRSLFFHPTRHEWTKGAVTNNKGNDKVIRAFAAYLNKAPKKAVLVLINKGRDVPETKRLIASYGIGGSVLWLEPMPKHRLVELYNAADVILDQFSLGWFGQIVLEAMACGKPTLTFLKWREGLYVEDPPIINVCQDADIVKSLIDLMSDQAKLVAAGARSREWIRKYHDRDAVCDAYIALYNSLCQGG